MKRYTDTEKAEAVELYRTEGPTAVQKQLGIPKGSVTRWAQAVGTETVSNERNAAAVAAAKAVTAERRARVAAALWEIADLASQREIELVPESSLRDVVGARTRAIHDAQLLEGGATGRIDMPERREVVADDAQRSALRLVG